MIYFDYKKTSYADGMREDIAPAYRAVWNIISKPGSEWTGAEHVAIAIDDFNRGLSLPLETLPTPVPGEPSHYRIPDLAAEAWNELMQSAGQQIIESAHHATADVIAK